MDDKNIDKNVEYVKYIHENVYYGNELSEDMLDIINKITDYDILVKDMTLLGFLSKYKRIDIIEVLLEKDIDINKKDKWGNTALIYACYNCPVLIYGWESNFMDENVLELLLKHPQCDVNIQNNEGLTALMEACDSIHKSNISLLLEHKSNVNLQNNEGNTAIMHLLESNMDCGFDNEIIEQILFYNKYYTVDINISNKYGLTVIMYAIIYGDDEILKMLLNHNLYFNTIKYDIKQTNLGKSHLMLASVKNSTIIKILLNLNVDINEQTKKGNTMLIKACKLGYTPTIKLLLKSPHCDVNIQNNTGNTALMEAFLNDKHAKMLLKSQKCDVNIQNNNGDTALILACDYDHNIEIILKYGKNINLNIKNNKGVSAATHPNFIYLQKKLKQQQ